MELETRNQTKRVQAAMSPVIVAELSNQITLQDARSKMARVERHTVHSPWTKETREWCKAMKRSMSSLQGSKHFDDYWLHSARTQDAIRRSLFESNFGWTKKLFCIAENNSHLNGYFAFRPVSAVKTDEVYDLVACMKVLSDANDHEYKHYVRLYKWMEREMALSTRQEERKE